MKKIKLKKATKNLKRIIQYLMNNGQLLFMIETTKKESNLLQFDIVKFSPSTHFPFHLDGISPIPSSLKLSDSGQIPLIEQRKNYGQKNHKIPKLINLVLIRI